MLPGDYAKLQEVSERNKAEYAPEVHCGLFRAMRVFRELYGGPPINIW